MFLSFSCSIRSCASYAATSKIKISRISILCFFDRLSRYSLRVVYRNLVINFYEIESIKLLNVSKFAALTIQELGGIAKVEWLPEDEAVIMRRFNIYLELIVYDS